MKITNRIINSIKQDIRKGEYDTNPLSFAYYLHFMLLNHDQSTEKTDLLEWAERYCKDILASKHKTKQVDDEITAALLIYKVFKISKNEHLAKTEYLNTLLSKYEKNGLYFDSFFHTIIIKYSLDNLEKFLHKDIIVKIIKDPKCLAFCQDISDSLKKGLMFRINEELQEDKVNVFDEFYYYWYLFRNKNLDKKNGFMLKINAYCEQWYLNEEDKLPHLPKALLFDITKRLNDGFYIVSEAELEGKGLTRFGAILFLITAGVYIFGIYLVIHNWTFILPELTKISLWLMIVLFCLVLVYMLNL